MMATAVPQSTPPPSATFINIEDFDAKFQSSEVTQIDTQTSTQVRNLPNSFIFIGTPNANAALSVRTGSEAGDSTTSSGPDLAGINWIGKLLEYHQAHPGTVTPSFTESIVPGFTPRFACLVTINERPEPFGTPTQAFSRKKDAKQHACKLAIEWLVENGHMPSIDSVTFPKSHPQLVHQPLTGSASSITSTAASSTELSPATKVVQLCLELRMNTPTYVMNNDPSVPMFWSGYAHFPNDPRVDGRIGEFSKVFGKKNAKDQCVMAVLEFLHGVKKHTDGMMMDG